VQAEPSTDKNKRFRHFIEDDIAHEKRLRDIIVNAIGEWPKRDGFALVSARASE